MYTYVDKKSFKLFFAKKWIDNLVCALMVKNLLSRFYLMKQKQGTFLEEFLGQKRLTRAKALPRLIQVVAFTDFGIGVLKLLAAKQQQSGWRECTMDWRTVAKRCRRHRSPDSILWSASATKTRFLGLSQRGLWLRHHQGHQGHRSIRGVLRKVGRPVGIPGQCAKSESPGDSSQQTGHGIPPRGLECCTQERCQWSPSCVPSCFRHIWGLTQWRVPGEANFERDTHQGLWKAYIFNLPKGLPCQISNARGWCLEFENAIRNHPQQWKTLQNPNSSIGNVEIKRTSNQQVF